MATAIQAHNNQQGTIRRANNLGNVVEENNENQQQQVSIGVIASSMRVLSSFFSSITPSYSTSSQSITAIEPNNRGKFNLEMKVRLDGDMVYSCSGCCTHIANNEEIVSRSFHGKGGKAYLFHTAFNVKFGPAEERLFFTGHHVSLIVILLYKVFNNISL